MTPIRTVSSCAAIIVATGTLLAAVSAQAVPLIDNVCSDTPTGFLPSCTCKSPSGYTISLQQIAPGTELNTYKYTVSGSGNAKVNAIRDVQIVVPRPVSNSNVNPIGSGIILAPPGDVTRIRTYCEPDPNSGNNKGNCQGFLVHASVHSATNSSGLLDLAAGSSVADGMVTVNIIGGNGNTELCSAVTNTGALVQPPAGIAGPGDIGDAFQPKFVKQQTQVAGGKCAADLVFDKKGNVVDVTTATPGCFFGSPGHLDSNNQMSNFPTEDLIIGGDPNIPGSGQKLQNNTGPHGFTFGNNTTTCYGPKIPSPAKCVCTTSPCP